MELSLENFRSFEEPRQFSLPPAGLVLVQGINGTGKSNFMDAILFGLYGSGGTKYGNKESFRLQDVVTFGQKKCKIVLRYDSWVITRSKGPDRLVLTYASGEIEDAAAQAMINEKFGTDFTITSYITQEGKDAFFNLGSAARMAFLEKLALGDVDISGIKRRIKNKIKERKDHLLETSAECKSIGSLELKEPQPVDFPLTGKYSEIKLKNEAIRWKRNTNRLVKLRKELTEQTAKQAQYELSSQRLELLEGQFTTLSADMSSLGEKLSTLPSCETTELEARLESLKLHKELIQTRASHLADKQQYQALCAIELGQMQEELESLALLPNSLIDHSLELKSQVLAKAEQLKLQTKLAKLETELAELDSVETYITAIKQLEAQEQELLNKLARQQERKVLRQCPNCQVFLRLGQNNLELTHELGALSLDDEPDLRKKLEEVRTEKEDYTQAMNEAKILENSRTRLTEKLAQLPELDLALDYETLYTSHKDELLAQEARLKRIAALKQKMALGEFSLSVQAVKRRLDTKALSIKQMEYNLAKFTGPEEESDLETLQDLLTSSKLVQQQQIMLSRQLTEARDRKIKLLEQLEGLPILEDCLEDLARLAASLKEAEQAESEFKARNLKIRLYEDYHREHLAYLQWKKRLDKSRLAERNAQVSLATAEKLLRKVLETESTAVLNAITTINEHLRYYLDKFFVDPITVELRSFKKLASGEDKPEITIVVGYRGNECKVHNISGGEKVKVKLAICLALNSMTGGKLLILDEVLSQVDINMIEEINEVLRVEAQEQGKLIIMTLHGSNESQFDYVHKMD